MVEKKADLEAMRHSMAHIMAAAVLRLWPSAKLGVGPVVENGFYYDILIDDYSISEEDFSSIEKHMKSIIKEDQVFEQKDETITKALSWAKDNKQPFKVDLLNDLKRSGTTLAKDLSPEELGSIASTSSKVNNVGFYSNGEFTDLCRGPHLKSTKQVGAFKLMRVAGAYWRGDTKKPQMQRLYGVGFATDKQLETYLAQQEEAKKRDHRKVGRELDLFAFSELVGPGLPLFTPKGTVLRELLSSYSQELRKAYGFKPVWTPHMTKKELYEKSGHWEKFGEELFLVESQQSSDEFVLKPMNCPHHSQIYNSQPRSYRDLPIKYMETTTDYRDEKSGELHGLSRVRALTQDDSHVYCSVDQIDTVVEELISSVKTLYTTLGMDLSIELSLRDDSDAYLGEQVLWERAEKQLQQVAKKNKLKFRETKGDAAFYGPKIDFKAADALGRHWQVATIQLDFVQPQRFELSYINSEGSSETPVMIHCAMLGTIERFLSVYIEHTSGRFPFWLAPVQVSLISVNDSTTDYSDRVEEVLCDTVLNAPLKYNELRYETDFRNISLGKKIREAEVKKIPLIIIVGPKDAADEQVSLRSDSGESKIKLSELKKHLVSFNDKQ